MDQKQVHYRNGQVFVMAVILTDGSQVFDVYSNSATGEEFMCLAHAASSAEALDACDKIAAILRATEMVFPYAPRDTLASRSAENAANGSSGALNL